MFRLVVRCVCAAGTIRWNDKCYGTKEWCQNMAWAGNNVGLFGLTTEAQKTVDGFVALKYDIEEVFECPNCEAKPDGSTGFLCGSKIKRGKIERADTCVGDELDEF